jgi:acyl-CoA thioesterase-2
VARPADTLLELLDLDRRSDDEWIGRTTEGRGRLFGGLVAAQALVAAGRTVSECSLHSLHAYFLRPGRPSVPIHYRVTHLKEGRNFRARQVVAIQGEEVVFALTASFARPEEGVAHQEPMPEAPPPDGLPDRDQLRGRREWAAMPIEMRACDPAERNEKGEPFERVWIRPRGVLPDDPLLHAAFLVYASDRTLMSTASRPHVGEGMKRRGASLDHSLWLHTPVRFDDWYLYTTHSPIARDARALCFGSVYSTDGTCVASVAQEGLIRFLPRREDEGVRK